MIRTGLWELTETSKHHEGERIAEDPLSSHQYISGTLMIRGKAYLASSTKDHQNATKEEVGRNTSRTITRSTSPSHELTAQWRKAQ